MDVIDLSILNELRENGRASATEISKRVNLSIPAVTERIRKLEQTGVIEQYTVRINRRKMEKRLLVFIMVNIDQTEHIDGFRELIVKHSCVMECHHLAGAYDYLLKVATEDTEALEDFLTNVLKKIPGVSSSNTFITLKTLKEEISVWE